MPYNLLIYGYIMFFHFYIYNIIRLKVKLWLKNVKMDFFSYNIL